VIPYTSVLTVKKLVEKLSKSDLIQRVCGLIGKDCIADEATVYLWNGTYYQRMVEAEWRNLIRETSKKTGVEWYERYFESIYEQIRAEAYKTPEQLAIPENWICFKNMIHDTATNEKILYDPEHYITNILPYSYTDDDPVEFLKMIASTLPNETDRDKIVSYFKYALTPSIKHQVALLCFGNGANGKTKLIELFMKLLGPLAGAASLTRFFGNESEKAKAALKGKTFVSFSEVGNSFMKRITMDMIKAIITNEFLTGREAYEKSSTWFNTVKPVFDGNKLPQIEDPDDMAFFRRFQIIEFKEKFVGENCDKMIADRVFRNEADAVLSYIARYQPKWDYEVDAAATAEKWLGIADNVRKYIGDKKLLETGHPAKYLEMYTTYHFYVAHCKTHALKAVSSKTFKSRLERAGVDISTGDGTECEPVENNAENEEAVEYDECETE
jgi:putative DNA primase/helicase